MSEGLARTRVVSQCELKHEQRGTDLVGAAGVDRFVWLKRCVPFGFHCRLAPVSCLNDNLQTTGEYDLEVVQWLELSYVGESFRRTKNWSKTLNR